MPPLALVGATATSGTTILADFDVAPIAATVEDAADWTIAPVVMGQHVNIVSAVIQVDPTDVVITVAPELTAGADYLLTAVNAADGGGPAVPSAAVVSVPVGFVLPASTEWPAGFLRSLMHSFGREIQTLTGHPITRLLTALGPTATDAAVETTLAFPPAGSGWIGGVRCSWTSKTAQGLHGLTFVAPRLHTIPALTAVHVDPTSIGVPVTV